MRLLHVSLKFGFRKTRQVYFKQCWQNTVWEKAKTENKPWDYYIVVLFDVFSPVKPNGDHKIINKFTHMEEEQIKTTCSSSSPYHLLMAESGQLIEGGFGLLFHCLMAIFIARDV